MTQGLNMTYVITSVSYLEAVWSARDCWGPKDYANEALLNLIPNHCSSTAG